MNTGRCSVFVEFCVVLRLFSSSHDSTFCIFRLHIHFYIYRTGGVLVSVLLSSVVGRGFEPWSGKTED